MNNDLISREALKEEIYNDKELSHWLNDSLMLKVFKYIDNAPTIELRTGRMVNGVIVPIEKLQGEWIYNQYDGNANIGNWHCSECGRIVYLLTKTGKKPYYNFCPNCGADMRGGVET